jgi:hypothetical protein
MLLLKYWLWQEVVAEGLEEVVAEVRDKWSQVFMFLVQQLIQRHSQSQLARVEQEPLDSTMAATAPIVNL